MNSNDDDANACRRLENAAWRLQECVTRGPSRSKTSRTFQSQRPSLSNHFSDSSLQRVPDAVDSIYTALNGMKNKHKLGNLLERHFDFAKNVTETSGSAKVQTLLPESDFRTFRPAVSAGEKALENYP